MTTIKAASQVQPYKFVRRILTSLTLSFAFLYCLSSQAVMLKAEAYAKLPAFQSPKLSPNGNKMVSLMTINGTPTIVVQEFAVGHNKTPPKEPILITMGDKGHAEDYWWANDNTLLISLRFVDNVGRNKWLGTRFLLFDLEKSRTIRINIQTNVHDFYKQHARLISLLPEDENHILVSVDDNPDSWASPMVHKVDVRNGKKIRIFSNKIGAYRLYFDNDRQLRFALKQSKKASSNTTKLLYRAHEQAKWQEVQKVDYFDPERLQIYGFHPKDNNLLLVTTDALADEQDISEYDQTPNLYEFDLTKKAIGDKYADQKREQAVLKVKRRFPLKVVKAVSHDTPKNRWLVLVYSDISAPSYYLIDLDKNQLAKLPDQYYQLKDVKHAAMKAVNYEARDGLNIPAYLTIPSNGASSNLPTVIYPHGGPWSHDRWGFDNYVQFLASRGYAVFQPQFRGSTGYGIEHERAGYKQWGKAIQDDITDGVNWLVNQGITDPNRICIMGGSYGGYAALIGAAKTPDLYSCAISTNGVTDLKLHFGKTKLTLFSSINRAVFNSYKDLAPYSPIHQSEKIKIPVLLMHGKKDSVVDYRHSKNLYKKLKKQKTPVEFITFKEGEHWRTNEQDEITKLEAIERFLAEHLSNDKTAARAQ